MGDELDFLRQEYTIDTPENVAFRYEVAGIGHRFIGALVDSALLAITLTLLTVLLVIFLGAVEGPEATMSPGDEGEIGWAGGLVLALYALVTFVLFWGYFILFELLWDGRTPGKRVAKTRVVRMDGNPAGAIEVVVRNLVRFIDFLPFAYGIGLITMFCNSQARRLGDFAAGTLVIKDRLSVTLDGVADALPAAADALPAAADARVSATAQPTPRPAMRQQLSPADRELIREVLHRHAAGTAPASLVVHLAAVMAAKLAMAPPRANQADSRQFLIQVLGAAPIGDSDPPLAN